ncbi:hypothetical protein M104_4995 [Bacteroides fragilis str. 1007-1-F |uniref:Uncharacterized protein n=1 Tax=Bacteroides fragilis str. 1007-1-F \|nr:hypothetical protein M147_0081 [Bacteroides fragilis str. 1007-1-F \
MTDNQNNVEMFAQMKKAAYLCCIRRTFFETQLCIQDRYI